MHSLLKTMAVLVGAALLSLLPGRALGQQCEEPNMLIVLDKSGSMAGSKWTQAKAAVQYVVTNYSAQLRLGLVLYAADTNCRAGTVRVDVGGDESQIMPILNATPQDSNTPIAATLLAMNSYQPLKAVDRRSFIMLITDGQDTCAANASDGVPAAATLYSGGIRTFVIGFGAGVDATFLNNVAQAGHTDNGNDGVAPYYYQANDQAQLQAAMADIIAQALVEQCDNRDNDCDGLTDEPWPDRNTLCSIQQGQCTFPGVWVCNATKDGLVCDAEVQTSPEVCDGFDNDCDGQVDEGFPDADGDGYNNCVDCDDGNAQVHPNQTEVCNGRDDDCDGAVDESDPQLGAACGASDTGECSRGTMQCVVDQMECVGELGPHAETCDNRDNDCDNSIDEGLSRECTTQCGVGQQICALGAWGSCSVPNPTPELCDGLDNDCDGQTDEDYDLLGDPCEAGLGVCHVTGVYVCAPNHLQAICNATPPAGTTEVCNTLDDDCDGAVDESDPDLGLPCGVCTAGEVAPCYREDGICEPGLWFCVDGALQCLGEVEPREEVCNGLDDDCDTLVDENSRPEVCDDSIDNDCDGLIDAYDPDCGTACTPGDREACGVSEGDCEEGVRTCDPTGAWGPCAGAIDPVPEVCDGRDNDCDGNIDEDAVPEICDNGIDDDCDGLIDGQDPDCGECNPGEERECGSDVGECRLGRQLCSAYGSWGVCAGTVEPEPERCDGLDNDCDGVLDEGSLCEGFEVCLCGQCADLCAAGECPAGSQVCVNDYCVSDRCCGVRCPAGEECQDGSCVDRCVLDPVQCQDGEICRMGVCVPADCYDPAHACQAGELCVQGVCQADPCAQASCGDGEYCRDGACLPLACQACGAGQVCEQGQCVDSLCAGVSCPGGRVCQNGECATDPCQGIYCPQGMVCAEGECQGDPCEPVTCPDGSHCVEGFCVPEGGGPDGGTDGSDAFDGADGATDGSDASDASDGASDGSDGATDGSDAGADDGSGDGSGCGCGTQGGPGQAVPWLLAAGLFLAWRRRSR